MTTDADVFTEADCMPRYDVGEQLPGTTAPRSRAAPLLKKANVPHPEANGATPKANAVKAPDSLPNRQYLL